MNKIMVIVYVPLLEEEFDVLIPINKKIGVIKQYILDTVFEVTGVRMENKDDLTLYDKDTGKRLMNDIYVKNSGLVNGTKILIV